MAKVHGFPGEWARVNGVVMGLWPLFVWIFVGGFSLAMFCFFSAALGAIGLVMAVAWIIWNLRLGLKKVESFFKGAKGEERIAAILQDLPDDCQIFHDYVAGKDHIDHVAVTPSGIYAIETKFWSGKVTLEDGRILVDGKLPARSPVAQALRETEEIRNKAQNDGLDRLHHADRGVRERHFRRRPGGAQGRDDPQFERAQGLPHGASFDFDPTRARPHRQAHGGMKW